MIDAIVRWAMARLEAFLNWFWDLTTPPDWLITGIDQAATESSEGLQRRNSA